MIHPTLRQVRLIPALVALALFPALMSCTPGTDISAEESDAVATLYDTNFGFGTVTSYALADSIVHFTGIGDPDSPRLSRDFDDEILAEVASQLSALGWTRRTDPTLADVVVLVGARARIDTSYLSWYGYWGWYYPYAPTWSWYYPYPVVTYNYTVGTLAILMTDVASADPATQTYTVRWVAAINGVMDDQQADVRARALDGVQQAFAQSPYLRGE